MIFKNTTKKIHQIILPAAPKTPSEFIRMKFIVLNVFTGFIAASTFFLTSSNSRNFSKLDFLIPDDYQNYQGILVILAFFAILITIYGCHCADLQSYKALVGYQIAVCILFISKLLFLTYLWKFSEEFTQTVIHNYQTADHFIKFNVGKILNCDNVTCDSMLSSSINNSFYNLICIISIMLGCQVSKVSIYLQQQKLIFFSFFFFCIKI